MRAVISFSRAHAVALSMFVCLLAGFVPGCAEPDRRKRPPAPKIAVPARSADRPETDPPAVVAALRASVHGKLDCSDCHAPSSKLEAEDLGKPSCKDSCHKQENRAYALTVHATARGAEGDVAARCEDCHGAHDVRKSDDPESRTFVRKLPFTCGKCHEESN